MTTETRLSQVESELANVTARLRRLEGRREAAPVRPAPAKPSGPEPEPEHEFAGPPELAPLNWGKPPQVSSLPPRPRRESTRPATPSTALDFEAVFGGRVLAWIGGGAILVGAVLFLGMVASRGWLDQEARTIIAAAISLAALLGGIWLHEREGRTDAAKALVGSAISGLFGTIAVATQVYSLISPGLGLVLGAAVAAVGFAIAVRWRSPLVAAIGSLGALATPLLTGLGFGGAGIAFVALALAATAAILVWQRWDWLALAAFVVSAPQLIGWIGLEGRGHLVLGIAVLAGFWLLYAGAAAGYELRNRAAELPAASWMLLLGAAATFVAPGYVLLDGTGHHTAAIVLLFGFALVQAGLGVLAMRLRLHYELGSLLIAIGIGLGAFALGETFHGPGLVVAWAAAAVTLAWLGSLLDATPDRSPSSAERMTIAAVVLLGLAIGHALLDEAPPSALAHGALDVADAAIALGACVASAVVVGWFARRIHHELGTLLIGIGITLVAFGLGLLLDGPTLVVAWAAGAVTLAALGSRLDATPDLARSDAGRLLIAAGGYLALAVGHTLIVEAPPSALVHGVSDLGVAVTAVGACAAAALLGGWSVRKVDPRLSRIVTFAAAGTLVYLGSVLIVDTIGVDAAGNIRQAGQTWLSAFWTVTGLGAVIVGLVRRTSDVRLAGLALLGVAIAKVWTFDLAELDQLSRVLSFVGLGFLLLVGAFAYQRIKPEVERTEEVAR
jgi:uncharacterized membrane protein